MMMTSTDQDPFYISAKLIKREHFEFLVQEKNGEFKELRAELLEIRLNLINMIGDILSGQFKHDLRAENDSM